MEAAAATQAVLTAARSAAPRFRTASDEELLVETAAWEAIGRLVDARRIASAAEIDQRSRPKLGEASLAFRQGQKDGPDLVTALTRVSHREANRRIGLGAALAPKLSLTGEELPGRYPTIAAAVETGELGLESARVIIGTLQATRKRAKPEQLEQLDIAEAALTVQGCTITPDLLKVHAVIWQAWLDPDGAEPDEEEQRRQRKLRFGDLRSDGLTPFSGLATPEFVATVKAAFDAHRPAGPLFRTDPGGDDPDHESTDPDGEDLGAQWIEAEGEKRTTGQRWFDTLEALVTAGMRAEQDGTGGSIKTPHEVIVTIAAADAAARRGQGWAQGVTARLSIPTIERVACSGSTRFMVLDDTGEPLHLGPQVRLFTPAQKKALAARDGGCAWPGCTAPVSWTEAHHIRWWKRDDGPTDVDNGVLLCTRHHHLIHATDPLHRIVVHERKLYLVPARWKGPPEVRHRMQRHPAWLLPPPRTDDPWTNPRAA